MTESTSYSQEAHGGTQEISLTANLEGIAEAIGFAKRSLEALGCSQSILVSLSVIIDEIVSNIAFYAYGDSEGDVTMQISLKPDVRDIEIVFIDGGIAFNPLDASETDLAQILKDHRIGGQGIRIVRNIADEMKYERRDGKNILRIGKHIGL